MITQTSSSVPVEFRLPRRIPRDDKLVIAREPDWGLRPRVGLRRPLVVPGFWHETPNDDDRPVHNRVRVLAAANGRPVGVEISLPGPLVNSCVSGDNGAVAAVWDRGRKGTDSASGIWLRTRAFQPIPLSGSALSVTATTGERSPRRAVFDRRAARG